MLAHRLALVFFALCVPSVFADNLDYSVGNYSPATVKVAGDGTVFVDYDALTPGSTGSFTLYIWVENGGAAASMPTAYCPITFQKLSSTDVTGWFSANPTSVSFTGYGSDPVPMAPGPGYTGIPGGSYVAVAISFTVPTGGVPDNPTQVKIKASTSGIPHLGEGHGVIVRMTAAASPPITLVSWLSDTNWVPLSDPYYNNTFQVVTRAKTLDVTATNPGSFYYNILVTCNVDVTFLEIDVSPLPVDFVLWGTNACHAWVGEVDVGNPDPTTAIALGHTMTFTTGPLSAGTQVFMTIHCQYALATLPSTTYLPRVYTWSCSATADSYTATSSASATGVMKKQ